MEESIYIHIYNKSIHFCLSPPLILHPVVCHCLHHFPSLLPPPSLIHLASRAVYSFPLPSLTPTSSSPFSLSLSLSPPQRSSDAVCFLAGSSSPSHKYTTHPHPNPLPSQLKLDPVRSILPKPSKYVTALIGIAGGWHGGAAPLLPPDANVSLQVICHRRMAPPPSL